MIGNILITLSSKSPPPAEPVMHGVVSRERERDLRREEREVPSRVNLKEGPIGVRILGQPTI